MAYSCFGFWLVFNFLPNSDCSLVVIFRRHLNGFDIKLQYKMQFPLLAHSADLRPLSCVIRVYVHYSKRTIGYDALIIQHSSCDI